MAVVRERDWPLILKFPEEEIMEGLAEEIFMFPELSTTGMVLIVAGLAAGYPWRVSELRA